MNDTRNGVVCHCSTKDDLCSNREFRNSKLLGYKFRRQFAIQNYIVDFYCHERKLVIEVDGEIHQKQLDKDQNRDQQLISLGYQVIRFTNEQIFNNTQQVLNYIAPLLKGGGHPERSEG